MPRHEVPTWRGCPNCKGEPHVIRETGTGCIMGCTGCGWFGQFSECWSSDKEPGSGRSQ